MAEEDRMLAVQKAAKKAEKDNRRLEREVSLKRSMLTIPWLNPDELRTICASSFLSLILLNVLTFHFRSVAVS